jgi:hypothetical protein
MRHDRDVGVLVDILKHQKPNTRKTPKLEKRKYQIASCRLQGYPCNQASPKNINTKFSYLVFLFLYVCNFPGVPERDPFGIWFLVFYTN